ncbi:major facilitator family transporter [Wolbachia endosymbiont of Wuchereria bancrofti]|nr:major facilitator family transporter [Wolbachia endosymbiont of Wuchereria bancrofti]
MTIKRTIELLKKTFLVSIGVDIVENLSLYMYLVFFNVLTLTINTHSYLYSKNTEPNCARRINYISCNTF